MSREKEFIKKIIIKNVKAMQEIRLLIEGLQSVFSDIDACVLYDTIDFSDEIADFLNIPKDETVINPDGYCRDWIFQEIYILSELPINSEVIPPQTDSFIEKLFKERKLNEEKL